MNIKYPILILALASSTMVLAQGQRPESAGQGRPDQSQMPQHTENMPMGDGDNHMQDHAQEMRDHMEDMDAENMPMGDGDNHMQDMQRNGDHMEDMDDENMEMGEEGKPENPGARGEQMKKDNAQGPDLEKLQEKRGEDDRTEAGKGSEQGQASREENSRKWWRFWE